jgi:hypothetical protein
VSGNLPVTECCHIEAQCTWELFKKWLKVLMLVGMYSY